MQTIPLENLSPAFHALFTNQLPANLRCSGILQGKASGLFLSDSAENPTWGLVYELGNGTVYWGGALNKEIVSELIETLRKHGDVLFGFFEGDPIRSLLLSAARSDSTPLRAEYMGYTLESDNRSKEVDLAALVARLPKETRIIPMTAENLPRCEWYESVLQSNGSIENFLAFGRGFLLMEGDEILAEAYSTCFQPDLAEVGILTREAHRGKGYATGLCAHLIQSYEDEGIRTYWNCAKQNAASTRLAKALGFPLEREYKLWALFRREERK
jgi:RimJ/RimL family protein N-acetyltransferase